MDDDTFSHRATPNNNNNNSEQDIVDQLDVGSTARVDIGVHFEVEGAAADERLVTAVAAELLEPFERDRWLLPVLGFSSSVVEDCYDATHGATRVLGLWLSAALIALVVVMRVANMLRGVAVTQHFGHWLSVTIVGAIIAVSIPCVLCTVKDRITENRQTLRRVSLGHAFVWSITCVYSGTILLQESCIYAEGSDHRWEVIMYMTMWPCAVSVMIPLFICELLCVSFPCAALVCMAFTVSFAGVVLAGASAPLPMTISFILYAASTISIMYAMASSGRQRFISQVHSARLQAGLDLATAKMAKLESDAKLHSLQMHQMESEAALQSLRLTQQGSEVVIRDTKKELTRTQIERTKAEIGSCSESGQLNILKRINRVKRAPKLAEAWADGFNWEHSQGGSEEQVAPKMTCLAVSSPDRRSSHRKRSETDTSPSLIPSCVLQEV
jgi:hypothetical protein